MAEPGRGGGERCHPPLPRVVELFGRRRRSQWGSWVAGYLPHRSEGITRHCWSDGAAGRSGGHRLVWGCDAGSAYHHSVETP